MSGLELSSTDVAASAPSTETANADSAPNLKATHGVGPLAHPDAVSGRRILWPYLLGVVGVHLLALLALLPYFFSWTGVALVVAGLYVFGTLGINLCYHRLLTHSSFVCPRWLEYTFATLGVCCLQDTPARWVATHRLHHQHSDEQPDPHSPLVNFVWGHVGWLMVQNRDVHTLAGMDRYARDILKDRYYMALEKNFLWLWVNAAQILIFFGGGFLAGWLSGGTAAAGLQLGASAVVWGVFVRLVAVWHITWSVNSVTHMWGYRNYETDENSRNNWLVALVSNGEGWHNNHHADQRSAAHGHRWWELDVTYLTIAGLRLVGLAQRVATPQAKVLARVER